MSDSKKNVRVRPVHRENPNLRKLARALIDLTIAQAETKKCAANKPAKASDVEAAE